MSERYLEHHYLDCQCDCASHTLRFTLDDEDGSLYLSTYLDSCRPWYKRIWVAVQYVFGHQSKFGAFDCTLLRPEDYGMLEQLLGASKVALGASQVLLETKKQWTKQDLTVKPLEGFEGLCQKEGK